MIKDKFEKNIGEQLRNAIEPVPAGAWEAIRAKLGTSGSVVNSPISPAGAIVGLIGSALLLVTMAVTDGEIQNPKGQTQNYHAAQIEDNALSTAKPIQNSTIETTETASTSATNGQTIRIEPKAPVTIISKPNASPKNPAPTHEQNIPIVHRVDKNTVTQIGTPPSEAKRLKKLKKLNEQITQNQQKQEQSQTTLNSTPIAKAKAQIGASVTTGYAPLIVKFENKGSGDQMYWEFGTMTDSREHQPEVVFNEPGVYSVNLTVANSKGEVSEDYIQITVKEGSSFYLPNSFTPNGDGLNDSYKVGAANNIKSFYLIITDEYGNQVFQTRNVNEAWDYKTTNGISDNRYFVSYRAVGIDGRIYTAKLKKINIR